MPELLSPAAQALLEQIVRQVVADRRKTVEEIAAATLRATADQVVPEDFDIDNGSLVKEAIRDQILSIADELEAQ